MSKIRPRLLAIAFLAAGTATLHPTPLCIAFAADQQTQPATAPSAVSRRVGAIKAINGSVITVAPDSGPDANVTLQATTRILRAAPGEKDLKNATPIQAQDLQVGDRILVAGKASGDGSTIMATTVVVMKRSDLDAKHQQDLQDWQKRGVDGPVKSVDEAAKTVTISVRGKEVVIHTSGTTVFRRYAPDSVNFDDAKPGTFQLIRPGDQLRARGERSADGSELTADEIVSGTFPIVSGLVNSVDASSSTVSVHDLLSKKIVIVKIAQQSQLHHLPPEMAQMFAMRLKARAGGMPAGVAAAGSGSASNGDTAKPAGSPGGTAAAGNGAGGARPGGAPDIQRLLSHLPAAGLTDLHKGDAVIILSTEGTAGVGTVITLLSGVEPILQAAPNAGQAMMLAPWSLGGPAGDAGGP